MAYTTIKKPSDYFNTKLYTGNGSTQSITGVGFQPDWIWIKNRDTVDSHQLIDAVRGSDKAIFSNLTNAEATDSQIVSSIDSDGFSVGNRTYSNGSGNSLVSWNWLASNTTASNTDGSITSTVSANTTSGFSIVSWTGTGSAGTIGHGLGAVPTMIIVKNRTDAGTDWYCYNVHNGNTHSILLNSNGAKVGPYTDNWNNTTPTSSVFTVGSSNSTGGSSGDNMIAYCFTDIKGYSKFGSYTGNGNADGTFVYTGFKPAFVIVKRSDGGTENWGISDNQRLNNSGNQDGGNGNYVPHMLATNLANAESQFGGGSSNEQDYLSNGFKIRSANAYANTSGATYIYMAFAEEPLVGDNPATAR